MNAIKKLKPFSTVLIGIILLQNFAFSSFTELSGSACYYNVHSIDQIVLQLTKSDQHTGPYKIKLHAIDFNTTCIKEFLFRYYRIYRHFLESGSSSHNPFYVHTTINAP